MLPRRSSYEGHVLVGELRCVRHGARGGSEMSVLFRLSQYVCVCACLPLFLVFSVAGSLCLSVYYPVCVFSLSV